MHPVISLVFDWRFWRFSSAHTWILVALLGLFLPFMTAAQESAAYRSETCAIRFLSKAPLEDITATSKKMRAIVIPDKNQFAFTVEMHSFDGFNSPLQKEHFHENYMETDLYKLASFSGKFIEKPDFSSEGTYSIRAKGTLEIHGVKQERIIKVEVKVGKGSLAFEADFTVLLEEHNIAIPKIVEQKIAQEVQVHVQGALLAK